MDVDVSDWTAKETKIEKRSRLEVMKSKGRICTEMKLIEFHADAISDDEFSGLHPLIDSLEAANDGL
eukprot:8484599-Ditylum_brightwellii.AAC.1